MGKFTSGLLPASAPIFKEPLSRTHPLLEKKRLLAMLSERDKLSEEKAAGDGPPDKTGASIEHAGHEAPSALEGDDEQHSR